jgi:N-methylhydantoinase A/oxoprolinase/acetone carboxylase beta subunit
VLAVVDANMERALRAVSVERGVDPRELALVAFGGAGPLHACALADALGMPAVVVPARAGVLSAVGLLTAPRRRDLVRSWPTPDDHAGLEAALADLAASAASLMAGEPDSVAPAARGTGLAIGAGVGPPGALGSSGDDVTVETTLDCRYRGQSHELTVPAVEAFHEAHERHNGYARRDHPVEVVAIRATAMRPPAVAIEDLPPVERAVPTGGRPVPGPTVLAESDCTIWVAEGWVAEPGAADAIVLRRAGSR